MSDNLTDKNGNIKDTKFKKLKTKPPKVYCSGFTGNRDQENPEKKRCDKQRLENFIFCKSHKYMADYSPEQMAELKFCHSGCAKWKYYSDTNTKKTCDECTIQDQKYRDDKKTAAQVIEKCRALDYDGHPCRNHKINNTAFCEIHEYMIPYTEYMMNNLTFCKGCKKYRYKQNTKTCEKCLDRGKENREKDKKTIIKCSGIIEDTGLPCYNQKSDINDYCGDHQTQYIREKLEAEGKKVCSNYEHNPKKCDIALPDNYAFKRCRQCNGNERIYDKRKRTVNESNPIIDNKKTCSCGHIGDLCEFIGDNGSAVKTCTKCRTKNKKQDARRSGRKRDWTGELEKNPARKLVKEAWRKNNPIKCHVYNTISRAKKYNEDPIKYKQHLAEQAAQWRKNNPDKVKDIRKHSYNVLSNRIVAYKHCALVKNIYWKLTDAEAANLMLGNCFYCNVEAVEGESLNGIDRMFNDQHYEIGFVCSCCAMCNLMKKDMDWPIFIKRCVHIASIHYDYNEMNLNLFVDGSCSSYSDYKIRALKKNLQFELTNEQYSKMIKMPCYLCSKSASNTHKNGIDRVDNDKEYTLDNIKPCCSICNYLKRDFSLSDIREKCLDIYSNCIKNKKHPIHKIDHGINGLLECEEIDIESCDDTNFDDLEDDLKNDTNTNISSVKKVIYKIQGDNTDFEFADVISDLSDNEIDDYFINKNNKEIKSKLTKDTYTRQSGGGTMESIYIPGVRKKQYFDKLTSEREERYKDPINAAKTFIEKKKIKTSIIKGKNQ
jgi:hypothetical protein